jgi:hypothetical protein
MSWYYIDNAGTTLGPVEESVLVSKWKSGGITEQTYVWNGTTVNDWSLINAVPFLLTKLKNSNKPAPGPPRGGAPKGRPAAGGGRPKKKAGGGRVNLLDSIRSGKALKKVEKKDLPATAGGSKGGSGGGMGPKKGGGKMSLQDQLKMKLGKRGGSGPKKTGGSGPKKTGGYEKKTGGAFSKPKSAGGGFKAKTSNSSSGGNSRFGGVKKAAASSPAAKSNFGGAKKSSGGGAKMSKFEMKKAIDSCNDDWVLKAISKLLS